MSGSLISAWSKQLDVLRSSATIRVFLAGIATGKTVTGCLAILHEWLPAGGTYMAVAPTYRTASDVMIPCMEEWLAAAGPRLARSDMVMTFERSSARIMIRSADRPDALRGPSVTAAWIDEAALCPGGPGGTIDVVLGRLREGGKLGRLLVTTTPKQPRIRGKRREDVKALLTSHGAEAIRAETWQNPFVSEDYYRFLKARYSGALARQELGGEFVTLGSGGVEADKIVIVDSAPTGLRWHRYFDLAWSARTTADRTATVKCAFADNGLIYFTGGWAERIKLPDVGSAIRRTVEADDPATAHGIETNSMGSQIWREVEAELRRFNVTGISVDRDKITRFAPLQARIGNGLVRFVRGAWCDDCISELAEFPDGEHDDYCDACSGSYLMAAQDQQAGSGKWLERMARI